jgi:hypothetical protein
MRKREPVNRPTVCRRAFFPAEEPEETAEESRLHVTSRGGYAIRPIPGTWRCEMAIRKKAVQAYPKKKAPPKKAAKKEAPQRPTTRLARDL